MKEEKLINYILDASFLLSYLLPDERVEKVDYIFQQFKDGKVNFISNQLLPFEIINGLKYALKSKRLSKKTANSLINDFISYEIEYHEVDLKEVLTLSIEKDLTVYDASYLYLSKTNKLPLLTLDERLKKLNPGMN